MFYLTIAVLGLFLANNMSRAPKLYTVDAKPAMIAGDTGFKHAHFELHQRMHRDMQIKEPRWWNKSKTYNDQVLQANGPKEKRTPFNLAYTKQGNLGQFPPVVGDRGKHL